MNESDNIQSYAFQDLAIRLEELFPEIDSDVAVNLLHDNAEYKQFYNKKKEMLEQNSFIQEVVDGHGQITISTKEHEILLDYLNVVNWMENMERVQLYFRGHIDGFSYLKKIGAI
ncbi:DUF6664 family protein [Petroclostridium sp. X23]|uniref:DUF6664 family protein n=1 Tax=Petroclostridium sp. X23 TaxID=3045146 RepID=UPI0024AD6295|nr:DUF6664 family protein [Petroclostridium sp. X23]WHH59765.1 hypothetical protein QKW49_03135 [Petroclostridium sp. X23]